MVKHRNKGIILKLFFWKLPLLLDVIVTLMCIKKSTKRFYTGMEKQTIRMHTAIYLLLFMGEKNQGLFTSMTFVHKIDIMRLHFGGTCEQELLNSSLSSKIKILTPRYGENGFLRSVCRLCQSEVSSDR